MMLFREINLCAFLTTAVHVSRIHSAFEFHGFQSLLFV